MVGEKNPYSRYERESHIPYPGWEEKLKAADLSDAVISKVTRYLGVDEEQPIEDDDPPDEEIGLNPD